MASQVVLFDFTPKPRAVRAEGNEEDALMYSYLALPNGAAVQEHLVYSDRESMGHVSDHNVRPMRSVATVD